jgi:hypothetical protein
MIETEDSMPDPEREWEQRRNYDDGTGKDGGI